MMIFSRFAPQLFLALLSILSASGVWAGSCAEQCHILKPYQQGMVNNPHHLSHYHYANGDIGCENCHQRSDEQIAREQKRYDDGYNNKSFYPQQYEDSFCLDCHEGRDELAQLTEPLEKLTGINPHISRHNRRSECFNCHKAHRRSRFICSECHTADWQTLLGEEWQIIHTQ
jgi:hypothetical protein